MGASNMTVQPSTQPQGKGGFTPPPATPMEGNPQLEQAINMSKDLRVDTSMDAKPAVYTGQPRIGQPNRYATTNWDRAQISNQAQPMSKGGGGGKGKGSIPSTSGQRLGGPAYLAPTSFPVTFRKPGEQTVQPPPPPAPAPAPAESY